MGGLLVVLFATFATSSPSVSSSCGEAINATRPDIQIQLWTQCLEENPRFSPKLKGGAHLMRGNAYFAAGDDTHAIADYTQSIQLTPDDTRGYDNRAMSYARLGDFDRAFADFAKSLALDPKDAQAYFGRGLTYSRAHQFDLAIADYGRTLEIDPTRTSAYIARGTTYESQGDVVEAMVDFDKAIERDPKNFRAYMVRGDAYSHQGRFRRALDDLDHAIQLSPDNLIPYNDKAWLLATCPDAKFRNGAEAVRLATKSIEIGDVQWQQHGTLAAAYAEAGRYKDAVSEAQRAMQMSKSVHLSEQEMAQLKEQIALYQTGKPYRQPVQGGATGPHEDH